MNQTMRSLLGTLSSRIRSPAKSANGQRERLVFGHMPNLVYAIGDVHGELGLLIELEQKIVDNARSFDGEKWLVVLGDSIDRGARSAQVIDHLLAPAPEGFKRLCIAGNHEIMMLDFLRDPYRSAYWLKMGGYETLLSYGLTDEQVRRNRSSPQKMKYLLESSIPDEHLRFLEDLPAAIVLPDFVLVHAGLSKRIPFAVQTDDVLTTMRNEGDPEGRRFVVHGHTIVEQPTIYGMNINVDTGAYLNRRLTAVRIARPTEITFLDVHTDKNPMRTASDE